MVEQGKFREDLFYRLNVVHMELPTLAQRKEDIPALIQHFLARYMARNRRRGLAISQECMQALLNYNWPGNVRELENVVESSATLSPTPMIGLDNLPARIRSTEAQQVFLEKALPEAFRGQLLPLSEVERLYILKVLKDVRQNKSMAARVLGLDRKTLRLKLKQYGYEAADEERE